VPDGRASSVIFQKGFTLALGNIISKALLLYDRLKVLPPRSLTKEPLLCNPKQISKDSECFSYCFSNKHLLPFPFSGKNGPKSHFIAILLETSPISI
jgi:hypothetical protein